MIPKRAGSSSHNHKYPTHTGSAAQRSPPTTFHGYHINWRIALELTDPKLNNHIHLIKMNTTTTSLGICYCTTTIGNHHTLDHVSTCASIPMVWVHARMGFIKSGKKSTFILQCRILTHCTYAKCTQWNPTSRYHPCSGLPTQNWIRTTAEKKMESFRLLSTKPSIQWFEYRLWCK